MFCLWWRCWQWWWWWWIKCFSLNSAGFSLALLPLCIVIVVADAVLVPAVDAGTEVNAEWTVTVRGRLCEHYV